MPGDSRRRCRADAVYKSGGIAAAASNPFILGGGDRMMIRYRAWVILGAAGASWCLALGGAGLVLGLAGWPAA